MAHANGSSLDSVLQLLELPQRRLVQLPMVDLGDQANNFTTLVDIRIAESVLLAVVSNELGTLFKIRGVQLHGESISGLRDIPNSLSNTVLKFASQSGSSILYWKMGHPLDDVEGADELRLLSLVGLFNDDVVDRHDYLVDEHEHAAIDASITHCNVMNATDAQYVTQVSIYADTVTWVRDVSASDGSTGNGAFVIELLDLDKDNDGVFDVNDLFPFVHGFSKDSDGDG
jgi:hypothetical protein